jgi:parallel beta-helix repeat protein
MKYFLPYILLLISLVSSAQAVISSQNNWTQVVAGSLPQSVSTNFVFQASTDLLVTDQKVNTTTIVTLVLGSDYTVTGGLGGVGTVNLISTGTNAVATGDQITISRNVPLTQTTAFTNGGLLTASMIESALDKLTTETQMLNERSLRSLQFQVNEPLSGILSLTARKNMYLGFDANGNISYLSGTSIPPSPGNYLTIANNLSDVASVITSKNNLKITVVNVKDYGAVGNGSTDDTAAINLAIAALTNYSELYFPSGNYKITAALTTLASLTNVRIYGDAARIINTNTGASGNTFVVNSTCSYINFDHLSFVGSATIRGNGIHIRLYSSYSNITDCFFSGCSDFAIHLSNNASAYNTGSRIENNTILAPLGDGIHVGNASDFLVSGNTMINTGDDSIGIIADTAAFPPLRGTVVGNHIYNSGSAGIRINEVNDLQVVGNDIHTTVLSGIEVNRYLSITAYNNRIAIKSNKLYNTQTTAGPRGAIWINFGNDITVTNNEIYNPANGSGIAFLDFDKLSIIGNTITGAPSRGIATDDTTTTNVAANWYSLVIQGNIIQSVTANEAIYVVPAATKTVNNLLITSNTGNALPSGNYIYYARVTTGVIGNNTSRDNRTVANGGTVSGVTEFNNTLWPKLGINVAPTTTSDLVITRSVPTAGASASVLIQGTLAAPVATDLHPNAFRDNTGYTATVNADAYASFDSLPVLSGAVNYNHYRGFQFRGSFSGSGTLDNISGFHNETTVSSGTVSAIKMFHGVRPQITGGTVTTLYGLYIDDLVTSGTSRYAIYTDGTAPWFSAGGQVYTSALLTTPAGAASVRMGATFNQTTQTGMAVMNSNATATGTMIGFYNSGGTYQGGILQTNSTTINYATSSDKRLKNNIRNLNDSGKIIDSITPRIYDWNWGGKDYHGFIAQELYKVFPEAVSKGDDNKEITTSWSVDYSKLTPVLTAEIKDLRSRVAKLEAAKAESRNWLFVGPLVSIFLSVLIIQIIRRK